MYAIKAKYFCELQDIYKQQYNKNEIHNIPIKF